MDDTRCHQFFQEPCDALQRRYEALRAVFVEGLSQRQAADRYGITHAALRKQIHEFREACRHGSSPPFFFRPIEEDEPRQPIRTPTTA